MKQIFLSLFVIAGIIAWSSTGFARELIPSQVASPGQLSVDGGLNGVSLTGLTTLLVGTVSGPQANILTSNIGGPYAGVSAVSGSANLQGTAVFQASSNVYGDMGATGSKLLYIQILAGNTVDFLGNVYSGTMDSATGTTSFNGPTNILATNFTGDGTISVGTGDMLTGALTTNTDNTGTLDLASASELVGAVTGVKSVDVVGGSNTAGITATINGAVQAHGFSLGTNTLDITGATTTATNAVIDTTLASPSVYGHIVVTGGVTSLGTGLAVDVTVPSTSLIAVGNQFNIIQGSGTGALATVVNDPANPLYTFSIVTAPGQAEIVSDFVPAQVPIVAPPPLPITPIAVPVATVIVAIPNPDPGLTTVLTSINALTTAAAVVNAEVQLSPLTPALVAPKVTFEGARESENLWLSRLDMCDQFSQYNKDDPSCQENNPQSGWWAKAFGYFGNRDDSGAFPGYSDIIAGTMIAYDVPLDPDTRAGLGFGYARSLIDGKDFNTKVDFDTYSLTAYIGHDQGPWFIDGSTSFGWNQYTGTRVIEFPGVDLTANSGYAGQDYSAFLKTGFHIPVPAKFILTPLVSLQYSRVNMDSYTESGAGDVDLHVKPQDYDFLESGLGAKVERPFGFKSMTVVPDLHFKWLYDFLNPTMQQTAEFQTPGATSFTTPGLRTSPDTYDAGTGITFLSCECSRTKWSLSADYDYFWRNDGYSANQATMRLDLNF